MEGTNRHVQCPKCSQRLYGGLLIQTSHDIYSSYKQQQAKKEQKSAQYLTSHLRLANQKPPKSLGVRKKWAPTRLFNPKGLPLSPLPSSAFLDEHEIIHAFLLPTPELLSGFLKWSGVVLFSPGFFTFFVVPGFGPLQKSMPDIHPKTSMSSHLPVLGWSSRGCFSLQDRRVNNLTQSLWKLAKKNKTCYSLVSC